MLYEAGMDPDKVCQSAQAFIEGLSQGERAYLRYNSCAEREASLGDACRKHVRGSVQCRTLP